MPRDVLIGLALAVAGCGGLGSHAPRVPSVAAVPRPTTIDAKRVLLAASYQAISEKNDAQAIALLDALCPVYPEMEDYCLHYQALSHAHAGDVATAATLWARLGATHPQSLFAPSAALQRGRLLRAGGDLPGARTLLESARASDDEPVALEAQLELADLELAAGNPSAAQADLMEVRRRAPDTPLGRTAKQRVEDLRSRDPSLVPHGAALEDELRLLLTERDFAAAQRIAEQLLVNAPPPDRAEILRLRASAELGGGQIDDGLATLQEIGREEPNAGAAPEAQFRYASVLWNRDRNQEAEEAFLEFRRRYSGDAHMPDTLYALARIAQGDGRAEEAVATYARLADAYPSSPLAREASWRIGWIRYQQARWREAAAAFDQVPHDPDGGDADAQYWRARALERAGDSAEAARIYRAILAEAPASYYALWAERRLGRPPVAPRAVTPPRPPPGIGAVPPDTNPYHWVRANELQASGLRPLSLAELRAFEHANASQAAATMPILSAYQAVEGYRDAIRLARARGVSDPGILYPLAYWPQVARHTDRTGVDPLLVLAVMRQESLFDPGARSPADARGLMQLLPGTAERVARRIGEPTPSGRLFDPDTNIDLGIAHLRELLEAHPGEPVKAIAAYNGGEEAVAKWERRFGGVEPDEFVESITYRETRDYVKRVVGGYRHYQQTYAGS